MAAWHSASASSAEAARPGGELLGWGLKNQQIHSSVCKFSGWWCQPFVGWVGWESKKRNKIWENKQCSKPATRYTFNRYTYTQYLNILNRDRGRHAPISWYLWRTYIQGQRCLRVNLSWPFSRIRIKMWESWCASHPCPQSASGAGRA